MTELTFPAPCPPWSINQERTKHWSWRAKRVRWWRDTAMVAAKAAQVQPLGPTTVRCTLPFPRNARRDPANFLPPVKAIIDGLVDAGVWPDDTGDWVYLAEPELTVGSDVVVTLLPRAADLTNTTSPQP